MRIDRAVFYRSKVWVSLQVVFGFKFKFKYEFKYEFKFELKLKFEFEYVWFGLEFVFELQRI